MPDKKVAVIDLGTNTFNLLIAELFQDYFTVIHSSKEGVSLGMGGINKQFIAKDAFERGINALNKFKEICKKNQVESITAIGTSALRDAKNSPDFLNQVLKETGIQIQIVSGEKEADLIYQGICWSYDFDEAAIIMDIGGGSTEFILADKNGIIDKRSFDIGISRIYQEFEFQNPYSKNDIYKIENFLNQQVGDFFKNINCKILIGASGSFETFYEIMYGERIEKYKKAIPVPTDDFNKILDSIIHSTQEERDQNPHIIPIRKKMIPISAIKTRWVIQNLGIQKIFVSSCSLKEGVLKDQQEQRKR